MTGRSPFPSFFMGGFECSMCLLPDGRRLDQIAASQHDRKCAEDYRLLREAGLLTVREAIRWPLVDQRGRLELASLAPAVRAARDEGLTAIWDLFHYGFPEDVDLFSREFPSRFAAYCGAVAAYLARELPEPRFYTPINEISYFSYTAGETALFAPFCTGRGMELKRQLVQATLAGIDAIRTTDPSARFVHADPLVHLVPPVDDPGLAPEVERFNREVVFEAWLMLAGRKDPELGGSEEALDLVGINVYRYCQWEYGREGRFLDPADPRWTPIRDMLRLAWEQLRHPLIIAETGQNGPHRPGWLRYLFAEVQAARSMGVPVLGICWYPVMNCPDWYDPTSLFPAGLWDVVPEGPELRRVPYLPVLEVLREAQRELGEQEARLEGVAPEPPRAGVSQMRSANSLGCPEKPGALGRELLLAGEQSAVSCYTLKPGQGVSPRAYPGTEVGLYIIEGEAYVSDWQTDRRAQPGDVLLIPAGTPFGLGNAGTTTCRILQFATPRPWSADYQGPEPSNLLLPVKT